MNDIFISNRRRETSGYARRLFDQLSARFGADRVVMDQDMIENRNAIGREKRDTGEPDPGGSETQAAIEKKAAASDVLLAMIGNGWREGVVSGHSLDDPEDLARREITMALEHGVPVIPVLVEGAHLPEENALPRGLRPLARTRPFPLGVEHFPEQAQELIAAVEHRAMNRGGFSAEEESVDRVTREEMEPGRAGGERSRSMVAAPGKPVWRLRSRVALRAGQSRTCEGSRFLGEGLGSGRARRKRCGRIRGSGGPPASIGLSVRERRAI